MLFYLPMSEPTTPAPEVKTESIQEILLGQIDFYRTHSSISEEYAQEYRDISAKITRNHTLTSRELYVIYRALEMNIDWDEINQQENAG